MTRSCLSVAFFITSEYTRFFLPEEALRIKSENGVDLTVFDFENIDILYLFRSYQAIFQGRQGYIFPGCDCQPDQHPP